MADDKVAGPGLNVVRFDVFSFVGWRDERLHSLEFPSHHTVLLENKSFVVISTNNDKPT